MFPKMYVLISASKRSNRLLYVHEGIINIVGDWGYSLN